ncbi:MAG TPA: hypothetical protein VFK05_01550 [Polyangiaceae bacterium]|nr:hypothetical protein [Polyangiaceae bacterium]
MASELFAKNRVILSHFDSYSTALVFARFGKTLLAPEALPEGAALAAAPAAVENIHGGDAVLQATIERYGLSAAELFREAQFDAWLTAGSDRLRIHLLRFKTFLAPAEAIAPHGGVFKPISELRGSAPLELGLVRGVFNLIMGGDQKRG